MNSKLPLFEQFIGENKSDIKNVSRIVRDQLMKENSCTAWDINNGMCDQFSADVIEKMGGDGDNLYELTGDMFFTDDIEFAEDNWDDITKTEYGVWGNKMIKIYGKPPVPIESIVSIPSHVWVYYKGKHYDAEAINGVNKWYELPIFKKHFAKLKK